MMGSSYLSPGPEVAEDVKADHGRCGRCGGGGGVAQERGLLRHICGKKETKERYSYGLAFTVMRHLHTVATRAGAAITAISAASISRRLLTPRPSFTTSSAQSLLFHTSTRTYPSCSTSPYSPYRSCSSSRRSPEWARGAGGGEQAAGDGGGRNRRREGR